MQKDDMRLTSGDRSGAPSIRLTKPLLEAMWQALNAALVGAGFDGGDFDGQNPEHFRRALDWVEQEQARRADGAAPDTDRSGT